jgi:hypothetical protein
MVSNARLSHQRHHSSGDKPKPRPDEPLDHGSTGSGSHPADDLSTNDPTGARSPPDYLPSGPSKPMPHYWPAEPETK